MKDMEGMFDDIKEETTQTKLTGTDKDKKTADKAVCDKRQATRPLPTRCTTPCSPST
jgi:hypothetical protein